MLPKVSNFGRARTFRLVARNALSAAENKQVEEHEAKVQEMAAKVAQATLDQLKSQLEADMVKLRLQLPSKKTQAVETALDVKYVRDRQA